MTAHLSPEDRDELDRLRGELEALIRKWDGLYGRFSSVTARMTLTDCTEDVFRVLHPVDPTP